MIRRRALRVAITATSSVWPTRFGTVFPGLSPWPRETLTVTCAGVGAVEPARGNCATHRLKWLLARDVLNTDPAAATREILPLSRPTPWAASRTMQPLTPRQ